MKNVHDSLKMAYENEESKPLQMDLYAPGKAQGKKSVRIV